MIFRVTCIVFFLFLQAVFTIQFNLIYVNVNVHTVSVTGASSSVTHYMQFQDMYPVAYHVEINGLNLHVSVLTEQPLCAVAGHVCAG